MNKLDISYSKKSKKLYIKLLKDKLESVMPEVHKQVRVYEEKLKSGQLSVSPSNNPLFSE